MREPFYPPYRQVSRISNIKVISIDLFSLRLAAIIRYVKVAAWAALFLLAIATSHGAASPVTFHKDIAPILLAHCTPCHRPGESAPFSLITYADAAKRARQIALVTHRRYMPPWLPAAGFGEFDGERRLSSAQIETLARWAADGAPEGVPSGSAPPRFTPGWQLGPPDLVLTLPKPFSVPAGGGDVFWNFILPVSLPGMRYVQAVEIRPGNGRAVHHATLLIDQARSARRSEKSPGEGFPGMDLAIETDTFDPDSHFLFWKPGSIVQREADGMAWRLDGGSDLVLNAHFHPTGKPEEVQLSVGLYFTDRPQTKFPMLLQLERDRALEIPAGARDFTISDDFTLPLDCDVLAVYPHAHYLGTLLEAFATLPDGRREWLIRIPEWDINWQAAYRYRKPVFLPGGTVISMRYHYDNSAQNSRNPNSPPRLVTAGNQSTDEMGHLWLQILPRGSGDRRAALQEALMRHRLDNAPDDYGAHFSLGVVLLSRKEYSDAASHLHAALRLNAQQPMAWNDLGAALQATGNLVEALEQFRQALRLAPGYTNALYNLANGLAAAGRLEESAASFRQLLAAAPEDTTASKQLAAVLTELGSKAAAEGRLETAAAAYRELAALLPGDADIRNNLGVILARSGERGPAIEQFEAALRIDPGHVSARRNLERLRPLPPVPR
jgi:tetratricopeptide (TPR) repeat protein